MKTYLRDYAKPNYQINTVDLTFELARQRTRVTAELTLKGQGPLKLNGEGLRLIAINLSDDQYQITDEYLIIPNPPAEFTLKTTVEINPEANTSLRGLYTSRDLFCTQCESHGFRRMTYYLDRPDVMAKFRVTLIADKQKYPVLLSNGNCIESQDLPQGQHSKTYVDPFKKPCYLFALVAGDLAVNTDEFITQSGRKISLLLYAESQYIKQTDYALAALKKAMRWDEQEYGREYDLDQFMIVAVSDFNSGAMENKGLNLFNTKYILASPETATDQDYVNVESVVAHEYFHNWTGNRITCRDWFQLSLKEGLTVFRDQEFSRDMNSRSVYRIKDVNVLRNQQFPEDNGPTAHPVQPTEYLAVNNFYTPTVYNKGAEVVRLIQTISGPEKFRIGMDHYFKKFDGQAVTIEDFASCFTALNPFRDQFMLWYHQAGTPEVTIHYQQKNDQLILICRQAGNAQVIPIRVALIDPQGNTEQEQTLLLTKQQQDFVFTNTQPGTIPSLLRDFSAPIKLTTNITDDEYLFLFQQDSDGFARWEAGQKVALRQLLNFTTPAVFTAYGRIAQDTRLDPELRAELLAIPSLREMMQASTTPIVVKDLHQARVNFITQLAEKNKEIFIESWHNTENRSLKNQILHMLLYLPDAAITEIARVQALNDNNMTNVQAAMQALVWQQKSCAGEVLADFYQKWRKVDFVMDKWFMAQAIVPAADTVGKITELAKDSVFMPNNPNKVRALYGSFATGNAPSFHTSAGYELIKQQILAYDPINPSISSHLVTAFSQWQRFAEPQRSLQFNVLTALAAQTLSPAVTEIVSKCIKS